MNKDFRITVGFPHHPKTRKLQRRLGAEGTLALVYLWDFAAQNKPDGVLSGMDVEDIALACDWDGDAQQFVGTLVEFRWLDEVDGAYVLHNWREHNPYVSGAQARSEQAKRAASARWGGGNASSAGGDSPGDAVSTNEQCPEHEGAMPNHANSIDEQCSEHQSAMLNGAASIDEQCSSMLSASISNAPSPSPSPSPKQKKTKAKKEKLTVKQAGRFAAWYSVFPNKKAKGDAERAWARLDPDDELTARMVQAVEEQIAWRERMKAASEFVALWKHPATWINSQSWDDQLEEPKPKHDKRNQYDSDLKRWSDEKLNEIAAARRTRAVNTSH